VILLSKYKIKYNTQEELHLLINIGAKLFKDSLNKYLRNLSKQREVKEKDLFIELQ
jgi:hypothetical protein